MRPTNRAAYSVDPVDSGAPGNRDAFSTAAGIGLSRSRRGFRPRACVPQAVLGELRAELLTLDFPAFARCVADLLTRAGYQDVRLAERAGALGRRNRKGGYDLVMLAPGPGLLDTPRRRVIAQLKHYVAEERVQQKHVDELRGVAIRAMASEAILVTSGTFSGVVRDVGSASGSFKRRVVMPELAPLIPFSPPVHLVDGEDLAALLIHQGIGVREEAQGGPALDREYFDALRKPRPEKAGDKKKNDKVDLEVPTLPRRCMQDPDQTEAQYHPGNVKRPHTNTRGELTLTLTIDPLWGVVDSSDDFDSGNASAGKARAGQKTSDKEEA